MANLIWVCIIVEGLWVIVAWAILLFSLSHFIILYILHCVWRGIVQLKHHRGKALLCKIDDASNCKWVEFFIVLSRDDLHTPLLSSLLNTCYTYFFPCCLLVSLRSSSPFVFWVSYFFSLILSSETLNSVLTMGHHLIIQKSILAYGSLLLHVRSLRFFLMSSLVC